MNGMVFVFRRKRGAPVPFLDGRYFGHIGWGFQIDEYAYYFGATENTAGHMHVAPGGDNGWWARKGTLSEMLAEMANGQRHPAYDDYRMIPAPSCDPLKAIAAADATRTAGYRVVGVPDGNNCADQAWDIFRAYGIELPLLQTDMFPNSWYEALPGGAVTPL